jgi:hypothetical protein
MPVTAGHVPGLTSGLRRVRTDPRRFHSGRWFVLAEGVLVSAFGIAGLVSAALHPHAGPTGAPVLGLTSTPAAPQNIASATNPKPPPAGAALAPESATHAIPPEMNESSGSNAENPTPVTYSAPRTTGGLRLRGGVVAVAVLAAVVGVVVWLRLHDHDG